MTANDFALNLIFEERGKVFGQLILSPPVLVLSTTDDDCTSPLFHPSTDVHQPLLRHLHPRTRSTKSRSPMHRVSKATRMPCHTHTQAVKQGVVGNGGVGNLAFTVADIRVAKPQGGRNH